jgi:hypothetical protein
MTKYEWTKKEIESVTSEYPPDDPQYIEAFLAEVKKAGEKLTRTKFFKIYEACAPPKKVEADYFDYAVLDDHWNAADFREAWGSFEADPLPRIATKATFGRLPLPDDFCVLGGTPDWIQEEKFPICPKCDRDMALFLQLKSLPYEITKNNEPLSTYTFGDAGNFYLFRCATCDTYKNSWECY